MTKEGFSGINPFAALYARVFQLVLRPVSAMLPWREPRLLEGAGSFAALPDYLTKINADSILVVTGRPLVELGLTKPLTDALEQKGIRYTVFDEVESDPSTEDVEKCARLYNENGCSCIVAVGGGSAIDCAKGAAARITRPKLSVKQLGGLLKIRRALPPFIAVPTTAGTGSEATVAAVITDREKHRKYTINDPVLIPSAAVLDPTLTVGLPPHITAYTGMDALCHAVEAYIGRSNTKLTRSCAVEAVKLVFDNLPMVYRDGSDMNARANMLKASYLAGVAFTRAYVGLVHAIAHPLGGFYHIPHGAAVAGVMPVVLRAYEGAADKALAELADAVGIEGNDRHEKAEGFILAIEGFLSDMGLTSVFGQIKEEDIPVMTGYAYDEAVPLYPTPKLMGKREIAQVYRKLKQATTQ